MYYENGIIKFVSFLPLKTEAITINYESDRKNPIESY